MLKRLSDGTSRHRYFDLQVQPILISTINVVLVPGKSGVPLCFCLFFACSHVTRCSNSLKQYKKKDESVLPTLRFQEVDLQACPPFQCVCVCVLHKICLRRIHTFVAGASGVSVLLFVFQRKPHSPKVIRVQHGLRRAGSVSGLAPGGLHTRPPRRPPHLLETPR